MKVPTKLLVVVLVGMMILVILHREPKDFVAFLDVGQGDAILLQSGTQQVLVDGGQGMSVLAPLGEELPWFDRTIEVVVVTHPQRDHFEGLLHVLDRYNVELVVLTYAPHESQLQEEWLKKIQDKGVTYKFAWAGQVMHVGEMELLIVSPLDSVEAAAATAADLNNASIVMRLDFQGGSWLLTGDAEHRVERLLTAHYADTDLLDVDILKAGHHGSNSSSHRGLLDATTPRAAVISVGEDNKFGHPHPAVLGRLDEMPVWRTDQHGTIKFVYTNSQWLLQTDK